MINFKIKVSSCSLFFLLISSVVQAEPCAQMQLQVNNTNADTTFNPAVNVTVVVKADTNDGGCNFFLDFSNGGASSYNTRRMLQGSEQWPYDILKTLSPVQSLKPISQATSANDVLSSTMPGYAGNDYQRQLQFWVQRDDSNPWRKAGNYTNDFVVTLYKGTLNNYTFVSSRQVSVNNNAQKKVDLSVIPTGGVFDIADVTEVLDFGILSSGLTKSCDIRVKTNSGFRLMASSENGGRLKHESENRHIDYSIKFNNTDYNLSSSREVANGGGNNVVSPATGILVPVTVQIGNVSNARAGNYSDTITLSLTAQ